MKVYACLLTGEEFYSDAKAVEDVSVARDPPSLSPFLLSATSASVLNFAGQVGRP